MVSLAEPFVHNHQQEGHSGIRSKIVMSFWRGLDPAVLPMRSSQKHPFRWMSFEKRLFGQHTCQKHHRYAVVRSATTNPVLRG
jgi:hypothetical protein